MAKFSQYYLEYVKGSLFSQLEWEERQKHFGAFFERDSSMEFTLGEGSNSTTYKHNVYHLSSNDNIIIMRIANQKTKEVIQDFKPIPVPHEPPCFVIIDNRYGCRRIAIQKNKEAFNTTDTLKKILQEILNKKMIAEHHIELKLHPQFYPRDFYKAWKLRQHTTQSIRFNISEGSLPKEFDAEELEDSYIMDFAIRVNEEECKKKYRPVLELNPPEDKQFLEVDYTSSFIRNMVKFHACTGASIELVTIDGSRFTCFIDDDEESDSIVSNEIDTEYLNALFPEPDKAEDEEVKKTITKAEEELVKFVNNMKVEVEENNGKENVA